MLKLSLRNLWARKFRLVTTAAAILLGIAFLSGTLVLTDTLRRTFDTLFSDANEGTDAFIRAETPFEDDFDLERPRLDASLLDVVRSVPGVAGADGNITTFAQLVGADGEALGSKGGAPSFGFSWPTVPELNPYRLVDGRGPAADDEIAIDRSLAERGDIELGATVKALTLGPTKAYRVVGIVSFGESNSQAGATAVFFTPEVAQETIGAPGMFDSISVHADDGVSQQRLVSDIEAALDRDGLEVLTGEEKTEEDQDAFAEIVDAIGIFLNSFAYIALFVGTYVIYNTFSILVAQRTREMALLRAIGASGRQVRLSVLFEAVGVGLVASVLGLLVGVGVAAALKQVFSAFGIDLPASGLVLRRSTVQTALIVGVLVTVLSAVLPARRASRISPLAALRDVAVDRSAGSHRRTVVGLVVLVASVVIGAIAFSSSGAGAAIGVGVAAVVVFVGVTILGPVIARPVARVIGAPLPRFRGVTGQLARENATRSPKRTASTAMGLAIGVGVVAAILVLATSLRNSFATAVDRQFLADYAISTEGFGTGFSPEVVQLAAAVPGAEAVSGLRYSQMQVDGDRKNISAVDPATVARVLGLGDVEGDVAALGTDGVAVNDEVAEDNDWAVGDVLPVTFAKTGDTRLRVVAVFEKSDILSPYLISDATYDANFNNQFVLQAFVKTAPGTDPVAFRAALEAAVADYPVAEVQTREEYKDTTIGQFNQVVNLVYVLLVLAIIVALLGIANTLALSIHERTREIGLLRAVGMTRAQVRSAVRWEAVVVSLLGTAIGIVIGVSFGVAIVHAATRIGTISLSVPVGGLVVVAVIAALAGVAAAWRPSRTAARLDMLQAIATE